MPETAKAEILSEIDYKNTKLSFGSCLRCAWYNLWRLLAFFEGVMVVLIAIIAGINFPNGEYFLASLFACLALGFLLMFPPLEALLLKFNAKRNKDTAYGKIFASRLVLGSSRQDEMMILPFADFRIARQSKTTYFFRVTYIHRKVEIMIAKDSVNEAGRARLERVFTDLAEAKAKEKPQRKGKKK